MNIVLRFKDNSSHEAGTQLIYLRVERYIQIEHGSTAVYLHKESYSSQWGDTNAFGSTSSQRLNCTPNSNGVEVCCDQFGGCSLRNGKLTQCLAIAKSKSKALHRSETRIRGSNRFIGH